jgi:hypothetical protein
MFRAGGARGRLLSLDSFFGSLVNHATLKVDASKNPGRGLEMAVAAALSLWIIVLHFLYLTHAGPLWRDEAGSIAFASMPSAAAIWHNLRYDNFPPLFVAVARAWTLAGLSSDADYRVLGFLTGLGTLGALWFAARTLGGRAPLLVLAFYATNPVAIRVGDSMRPYGLGIALIVLTHALTWRFAQAPRRSSLMWAAAAAVLSVQCLYQCAWFVAAFSIAAWTVTLAQRQWKTAAGIGVIGAAAAVSLLPHWHNLKQGGEWLDITKVSTSFGTIFNSLLDAVGACGTGMALAWAALFAMAATVAVLMGSRLRAWGMIYNAVTMLAGAAIYLVFLRTLGLRLRPWYFLILMAVSASAMDAIWAAIPIAALQWGRLACAALAALACAPACGSGARWRQSNVDLMAAHLKAVSQPGDVILVPWYYGTSLRRYLDTNLWTTLPPMADISIHRFDLLKKQILSPQPIAGLLKQTRLALRSGHAVWIAGAIPLSQPGGSSVLIPPGPGNGVKALDAVYFDYWASQLSAWILTNGASVTPATLAAPPGQTINPLEVWWLREARGWHGE